MSLGACWRGGGVGVCARCGAGEGDGDWNTGNQEDSERVSYWGSLKGV